MDEAGAIFDLPLKKPWYIAEFQGIGYTESASCGEKVSTKQKGYFNLCCFKSISFNRLITEKFLGIRNTFRNIKEENEMDNQELLQALRQIIREEVHTELQPIQNEVTSIKVTQENVTNKNIQLLMEGQKGMNDKFKRLYDLEEKVEDIQVAVSVLKALRVK